MDLANRLIEIARQDHEEWLTAWRREKRKGNDDAADACLSGANTVEQLLHRMEREVRKAA